MNTWIRVNNSTNLTDWSSSGSFLELSLHLSWAKHAKIATVLRAGALRHLLSDGSELAWISKNCLSDLLDSSNGFIFASCDDLTCSADLWVSRTGVFQKNVTGLIWACEIEKLNVEFQSSVWWNNTSSSSFSVSILRWASKSSFTSLFKLADSFVPSSDNLSNTKLKLERSSFLDWWIENGSVQ